MKYIVRIIVTIEILGLIYGAYLVNTEQEILGNKVIGFSALALIFIVMPLFLIYRFKKSGNHSRTIFSPTEKNEELEDFMKN